MAELAKSLRILKRWEPVIDRFDPGVGWMKMDRVQVLEGSEWRDLPVVEEGELTEALKRERLPEAMHWRLKW